MIDIKISGNFDALTSNITKIEGKLNMLNVPLRDLEDTLQKLFDIKFKNFDRLRDRLTPSYRKWKDKKGLPVGVKTGKTKKALVDGGQGVINRVVPFSKGGFVYEYGVHADTFYPRRGYPKNFDQWLQKNGDDLIGLDITEAEFLMDELTVNINRFLDTL